MILWLYSIILNRCVVVWGVARKQLRLFLYHCHNDQSVIETVVCKHDLRQYSKMHRNKVLAAVYKSYAI